LERKECVRKHLLTLQTRQLKILRKFLKRRPAMNGMIEKTLKNVELKENISYSNK
jgi:hypothetical protein